MNTRLPISLTPNFSWVIKVSKMREPFQRFLAREPETVETVSDITRPPHTWLKPGVNEVRVATPAAFLPQAVL